jgi:hypothetical protein
VSVPAGDAPGGPVGDPVGDGTPGDEVRVRAGEGRAQLVDQVQLRLGLLRGLSEFLHRARRPDGALICPRHKVEHTGKAVYSAILDLQNWRFTREESYLERARRAVLRTVDMLGEDPESRVPIFLPGRVDPANASNNAIDGGACADVIATLLEEAPSAFPEDETARCRQALERHVEGYLRHAARDRPIPAQRLWAGTGVARAARLFGRDDWAADALAGCRAALDDLTADGIAPYIPLHAPDCTHPGLADMSSFYHSRTPGFVLYIHEILGHEATENERERLVASLDALVAMRGGNGLKPLHNEAKAWYWESDHEVASHPFDVWALMAGARRLGVERYRNEAGRAMEEWIGHINPDGGVVSHHTRGTSFQCRVFWAGHAAWVARVIEDVPLQGTPREPFTLDLPVSGLVHVETPRAVAVLRGRKQPMSTLFGCDLGGGQIQSLVARPDPRITIGNELIEAPVRAGVPQGSFLLRPRGAPGRIARWRARLSAERKDLRFRLWLAAVEWRAGRWVAALLYPFRYVLWAPWRLASPELGAHLDTATEQTVTGKEVVFRGGVADPDGQRWPGAETERRYLFEDDRVELTDTLRLDGVSGRVRYRVPRHLGGVEVECEGAEAAGTARGAGTISLRADGGMVRLTVRGHWKT